MPIGPRNSRRRGMIVGAAIASSRSKKRQVAATSSNDQAASQDPYSTSNNLAQIEKLAELRDKGILTEEEFTAKKQQLLGL